jgi:hypothetical protein
MAAAPAPEGRAGAQVGLGKNVSPIGKWQIRQRLEIVSRHRGTVRNVW